MSDKYIHLILVCWPFDEWCRKIWYGLDESINVETDKIFYIILQ